MKILLSACVIVLVALYIDASHGHAVRERYHHTSDQYGHGDYQTARADQHHHYHAPVHVYMGESSEEDSSEESEEDGWGKTKTGMENCNTRAWTFQIGSNGFGPWGYIDEMGYLKGFNVDLIQAVCRQAGKRCFYIMGDAEDCWETSGGTEMPGTGLLDKWYDGCMGLLPSPERQNSFNFTMAFSPNWKVAVHYRAGEVPAEPYVLTGKKIGFVEGWPFGMPCLGRQNNFSGTKPVAYEATMYTSYEDMMQGLKNKEIDALLSWDAFDEEQRYKMGIEAIEPWFSCTTDGAAVMARYDSPVIEWWNAAFQDLVDSGAFSRLCTRAKVMHGHKGEMKCAGDY